MSNIKERLVLRLSAEGERTIQFFNALQPADWQQTVYVEGAHWTVMDVLRHFVSSEAGITRLIANIVDGGEGVPEEFDLDHYNQCGLGKLTGRSAADLLDEFALLRKQTVQIVNELGDQDLTKIGRHPFLGMVPVVDIIKLMYRHNQIHQRDLRRLLSG